MKQAHLLISGKVQGVWFRASTKQQAEQLHINGWVRNTNDGKVEALIQGDENQLQQLIQWCHQGPASAQVDEVQVDYEEPQETFDSFMVKH